MIRIGTRKSPLALWQANSIREQLLTYWPHLQVDLVPMSTSGDRFLHDKLLAVGGKGLFVKELEEYYSRVGHGKQVNVRKKRVNWVLEILNHYWPFGG